MGVVFRPKYAAYLDLIEAWCKALASGHPGACIPSLQQVEAAAAKARDYWKDHRRLYIWGTS